MLRGVHEVSDLVPFARGFPHAPGVLKALHIPIMNMVVIEGDQPAST